MAPTRMEYQITITKRNDFLSLELAVRRFLGCESNGCTFFQSAAYIDLRLAVCSFVLHGGPKPYALVLSVPPLLLSLLADGKTIQVKYPETSKKVKAPAAKEQGFIDALSLRAH